MTASAEGHWIEHVGAVRAPGGARASAWDERLTLAVLAKRAQERDPDALVRLAEAARERLRCFLLLQGWTDGRAPLAPMPSDEVEDDAVVDLRYAWLDDIVSCLVSGAPVVDVEVVHVRLRPGPNGDVVAGVDDWRVLLARLLRSTFLDSPALRLVVVVDDVPVAGPSANPLDEVRAVDADWVAAAKGFDVVAMLCDRGVLFRSDVIEHDYVIVRMSDQLVQVPDLLERLRGSGAGDVVVGPSGVTWFVPTDAHVQKLAVTMPALEAERFAGGIPLLVHDQPTWAALDASSYLADPLNIGLLHVIIGRRAHEVVQHATYALLRATGVVRQERVHGILVDERAPVAQIGPALGEHLLHELAELVARTQRMDDWRRFDPDEYVERNYGRTVLPEDASIIEFVVEHLPSVVGDPGRPMLLADVGTGPNLYPAMLLAPLLGPGGSIDLVELAEQNRRHLRSALLQTAEEQAQGIWRKFEELMIRRGGEAYIDAQAKVSAGANVVAGSIFDLPRDRYDLITSYFVAESITTSHQEFWQAIRSLGAAVRPNGALVVAHMVGSREYHAGEGTHFPSVLLSTEEIAEAYRDADLWFEMEVVGDPMLKARDGYHGMAIVVARRPA